MKKLHLLALVLLAGPLLAAGCQKTQPSAPVAQNDKPAVVQTATNTQPAVTATSTPGDKAATTTKPETNKAPTSTTKPAPATTDKTAVQIPQWPITVYVGTGCPHCARIEAKAAQTGLDKKVPLVFKEVFNDQTNAQEFLDVAKVCGLDVDNLGVPVMFDGKVCTVGEPDIAAYLDKLTLAYAKLKK